MSKIRKLSALAVLVVLALLASARERPAGACVVSGCVSHHIFICCSGTCWSEGC